MKIQCPACDGTGLIPDPKGHTDGKTRVTLVKCKPCGGSGKVDS